jgi:REP element-mobilizing transposase RayT
VVDRRFAFGQDEKERFRMLMRMMEKFSGCRVLSYCVMCNHVHLLLEVPPMPEGGISDEELLQRLRAIYREGEVAEVAREMREATASGNHGRLEQIRARYTYRMHDLSEFMKSLLQRFTQWFNGKHERSGTLWEDRFKSVIVESGIAARTIAAYIDLNPVRAGMVKDPAEYRWSSYGEAIGGGPRGNGKKAREGLVRACLSHEGVGFDAGRWAEVGVRYRELMGMALARKGGRLKGEEDSGGQKSALQLGEMLRQRVRYFTDGAVIGSRAFVNETFEAARGRFTEQRKDGARRMRGNAKPAAGLLWSARDLRVDIG